MKAKLTISKTSNSHTGNSIRVKIHDGSSGLLVAEVELSLENYAQAITGLAFVDAEWNFHPTEYTAGKIGKKRETKRIHVDKPSFKATAKNEVKDAVEASGELCDGWMLFDDGTSSQQHGEKHCVVLVRFVEEA